MGITDGLEVLIQSLPAAFKPPTGSAVVCLPHKASPRRYASWNASSSRSHRPASGRWAGATAGRESRGFRQAESPCPSSAAVDNTFASPPVDGPFHVTPAGLSKSRTGGAATTGRPCHEHEPGHEPYRFGVARPDRTGRVGSAA